MKRIYTAEDNAQWQIEGFDRKIQRIQISDSLLEEARQAKVRVQEDMKMRGWRTEISIPIANSAIAAYNGGRVRNNPRDKSQSEYFVFISDVLGDGEVSARVSEGTEMGAMHLSDCHEDVTSEGAAFFGDNFLSHVLEGKKKLDRIIIEEDQASFNAVLEKYKIRREREGTTTSKERI